MKLFRVFDAAEFVPDANAILDSHRSPPERGNALLAILEELEDHVWMTHQSWHEYCKNLPSARKERKVQSLSFRKNATKFRDNSVNLFKQFAAVAPLDINPEIQGLEQVFESFINHLSAWSRQPSEQPYDEIETRINALFRGRVGKKLPKSLQEDIPNIWAWRYERGIPPGLKDSGKPEPQRYGDLMCWLQIKHRAMDTGCPIVFITNDVKTNDWFAVDNGELRGPHPQLVQELRDEVGVELYIYTSEQFMHIAELYLREREIFVSHAKMPLRLPRIRLPDFGGIAAMASISALDVEFGHRMGHLHDSLAGFDTISARMNHLHDPLAGIGSLSESISSLVGIGSLSESMKHLHDSLAGFDTISARMNHLHDPLAGIGSLNESISSLAGIGSLSESMDSLWGFNPISDSMKHLHDSMAGISAFNDRMERFQSSLAGVNAFGDRMERLQTSLSDISAFSDSYSHSLSSLAGLTVGESYEGLLDPLKGFNAFGDRMERLQSSLAGISTYSDRMDRFHDSLSGVSAFYDRMDILDQQRMPHMMLESVLDEQRRLFEPMLEQQRLFQSVLDEQQRRTDRIIEEQRRITDNISKNMSS